MKQGDKVTGSLGSLAFGGVIVTMHGLPLEFVVELPCGQYVRTVDVKSVDQSADI